MNGYTQQLNTQDLHQRMTQYIHYQLLLLLQETIRMDHLLIQEERVEDLHLSQLVCYKLNKVIERFYLHQPQLLQWFQDLERSLQRPNRQDPLQLTELAFEGSRIRRASIHCAFLKPATVKKILDVAKDYATNHLLPQKQRFTTADVLSVYFDHYTRVHMFEFKLECASKLKIIHRETLSRLPLEPISLNDAGDEDISLDRMLEAAASWLDDNEFGIDINTHL
jgi:hypothetical protein